MNAQQTDPVIFRTLGSARAAFGSADIPCSSGGHPPGLTDFTTRAFPGNSAVLYGKQIHSAISYVYSPERGRHPGKPTCVGSCDALITGTKDIVLAVQTADCLPVALVGDRVAAVIHAGWRGLAGDILGAVTRRLRAEWGVPEDRLAAVVGIGIGRCHYVVGHEVKEALAGLETRAAGWCDGATVDLSEWATGRLLALGLPAEQVEQLQGCTWCSPHHHSFRRDGPAAGRQWSGICLVSEDRSS